MKFFRKFSQWMGIRKTDNHTSSSAEKGLSANQPPDSKKVAVSELKIGMVVVALDNPPNSMTDEFKHISIQTHRDIALIKEYCDHVYIQHRPFRRTLLGSLFQSPRSAHKELAVSPQQLSQHLRHELPQARRIIEQGLQIVQQTLEQVANNEPFDSSLCEDWIADCLDSIERNPTALFWLANIKNPQAYTVEHCLRVAILALALGSRLKLSRQELITLGLCGMLHDVGKAHVPEAVLNKDTPLSHEEMELVKAHTLLGYHYLLNENIDPQVYQAAYNHHEHIDGQGYPRQIDAHELSLCDRIIAIADSYDAMISDRCYRQGIPASQAISILYNEQNQRYDSQLVQSFIHMMGIYPVGSLVELDSGQLAIVLATHHSHKLEPVVEVITDNEKQLIEPITLDLSSQPLASDGQPLQIARSVADHELQFDLSTVILGSSNSASSVA